MKKSERVKSKILFNEIINNGKKVKNEYFTVFYIVKKEVKPLFGISTPKKIGNAVMRNKLRRRLREIIRELKLLFKNNRNYIIIMKKKCLEVDYQELKKSLQTLTGEIK